MRGTAERTPPGRASSQTGSRLATRNRSGVVATNGIAQATPAKCCVTFVRAAGGFAEAKKMLLAAEFFTGVKIR